MTGPRSKDRCARKGCTNPVAYPGAIYCGAACTALAEAGASLLASRLPSGPPHVDCDCMSCRPWTS